MVRIIGLPNSEWQNTRGIVIDVLQQTGNADNREYKLELNDGCRRWFLERHLVKSIPERLVRFFRVEVQDRWKQVDPLQVATLTGDHEELIHFLCDACGFTANRAQMETEEFFRCFDERMQRATAGATAVQHAASQAA